MSELNKVKVEVCRMRYDPGQYIGLLNVRFAAYAVQIRDARGHFVKPEPPSRVEFMAQAVYTLSEDEAYQLSGALIISLTDVRLQHAIADLRELFEVTWPLVQKVGAVDDPEVGWYKVERMIRVHGKVLLKTENK